MKNLNFNSGFTLIELLVVVAIIGILSSVVMTSLGSAKLKAADVVVKSDLSNVRTSIENYYDTLNGTYNNTAAAISGGACSTLNTAGTIFEDPGIQNAFINAVQVNGGVDGYCNLNDIGTAYAVAFPLKTTGSFWCIDSNGISRGLDSTDTPYDSLTGGTNPALDDGADMDCN